MLAEARELYNYTVGNEPFRSQIEEIRDNHTDYVMAKIKIRSIVFSADLQYGKDYCSRGKSCFTIQNIDSVFVKILGDMYDLWW